MPTSTLDTFESEKNLPSISILYNQKLIRNKWGCVTKAEELERKKPVIIGPNSFENRKIDY